MHAKASSHGWYIQLSWAADPGFSCLLFLIKTELLVAEPPVRENGIWACLFLAPYHPPPGVTAVIISSSPTSMGQAETCSWNGSLYLCRAEVSSVRTVLLIQSKPIALLNGFELGRV